jgi:hypothetical protein
MRRVTLWGSAPITGPGPFGLRQPTWRQQTRGTSKSALIDANPIAGVPPPRRNFVELTLLAPGSVHP